MARTMTPTPVAKDELEAASFSPVELEGSEVELFDLAVELAGRAARRLEAEYVRVTIDVAGANAETATFGRTEVIGIGIRLEGCEAPAPAGQVVELGVAGESSEAGR